MPPDFVHDVVIVGAGPCGLAVAARLCETTPSAVFTDDEHSRYHWINKHGHRMSLKNRKNGQIQAAERAGKQRYNILVLDSSSDQWMSNWSRLFKTFEIDHLRSPMFFHVDPADRDSLIAHAHECKQYGELQEICNCVGKEVSKHKRKTATKRRGKSPKANLEIDERDRKDYFTPSTTLFANHCDKIIDRYGLGSGVIRKESVIDIDFGATSDRPDLGEIFVLKTDHARHYGKTVVLAVGAGCKPTFPKQMHTCVTQAIGHVADEQLYGACHSMQIKHFPDPSVMAKIEAGNNTNVLVIGGGLTSAQISNLALRRGVTKVWHVMRSGFKVKPFDVDLEWMGKFQNHEKATFWSKDSDMERLSAIRKARGGGSINPPFAKILRQHLESGRMRLLEKTNVYPDNFDVAKQTWTVRSEPPNAEIEKVKFDYIYFATGVQADFEKIPCLQTIISKFPLHGHGGMPCLGEDLDWYGKDASANTVIKKGEPKDWARANHESNAGRVPLFITGRLAGLRLGPGAGNLEGARLGAERVVLGIEDYLAEKGEDKTSKDESSHDNMLYRYAAGVGSRYDSLDLEFDDLFE